MTFKRENRYLVIRWDDIYASLADDHIWMLNGLCREVEEYREKQGKEPTPNYVCIKDTYPEYEMVWEAIEERVTAKENNNKNHYQE